VALPPATPFTCQLTAVLVEFDTVAVNCCVAPVCTVAVPGATVTLTVGGGTVLLLLVSHPAKAISRIRHTKANALRCGIFTLLDCGSHPEVPHP
jgi:hypothetical protein